MRDYIVAIASYKREKVLRDRTLALCVKEGVDERKLHLFVDTEAQRKTYREALPNFDPNRIIVTHKKGLTAARNFMTDYFPEGQHILFMDDDLICLVFKTAWRTKPLPKLAEEMFNVLTRYKLQLGGPNPTGNDFWMKDTIKVGTYYICGAMFACINDHKLRRTALCEDYENSLLSIQKYGAVARFDYWAYKTVYFTKEGGMARLRNYDVIEESFMDLQRRFPKLCHVYYKKNERYKKLYGSATFPNLRIG